MKSRTLLTVTLCALAAVLLSAMAFAGHKVKLCHVTGEQLPNGKCQGIVIAVGSGAANAHVAHGDVIPPNPDAFEVGQKVEMACR